MPHSDLVKLAEAYPKSTILALRARAALTGKLYYFNGQNNRVRVFHAINRQARFENYVETGTYLGMTTDFLARMARDHAADVYSCEIDDRFFAIASRMVGSRTNVHLHHGNSVDFLRSLSPMLLPASNFVYLDAHWYDYLPLRDELSIIKECPNSVVMIDDFKVPADERFGWDRYDDEQEICLQHIDGSFGDNHVYFPSYPATHEEATYRGEMFARGYCVIAMSDPLAKVLDRIPLLRKHDGRPNASSGTLKAQES
jgi:predicted O-methyltransferase YrrM